MVSWGFRRHLIYLCSILTMIFVFIIICASLYDTPFNLKDVCISNLGNPNHNLRAWWVFSVAMCTMSLLIIPHYVYLYRRIDFYSNFIERLWLMLLILGSFGMFMVGIVNETMYELHVIFAAIAFGGIGLALFLSIIILIVRVIKREEWPNLKKFFVLFVILFFFLGIIISEVAKYGIEIPSDLNFTEWMAFFCILTWLFGITFIVKKETTKG